MFTIDDARKRKLAVKEEAVKLVNTAIAAGRALTKEEETKHEELLAEFHTLSATIQKHTDLTGFVPNNQPTNIRPNPRGIGGDSRSTAEVPEGIKAVHSWMRNGKYAVDTPLHIEQSPVSPGLAAAIPTTVLDSLRTYFANDPFRLAGSTIYNTPDTQPLVKPVISSGDDPDTFNEGQSATDSKPFETDSFTFGGQKYSRLVKVSDESLMNVAMDLPSEILSELGASVANKFTADISLAMLVALEGNSGCFVNNGSDTYEAVLNLIAALPPRFDDGSACFMGSRYALRSIRNTRATSSGVPLFNPQDGTVFGRKYVINDSLGRLVFGNFAAGAFVRKTPFVLQRLNELYSATGHIGFKGTQFLDSKFLASVHTIDVQPLYFTNLDAEGS